MRQQRTYGSVRGAISDDRPYRDQSFRSGRPDVSGDYLASDVGARQASPRLRCNAALRRHAAEGPEQGARQHDRRG
jgi:hypothetical protein